MNAGANKGFTLLELMLVIAIISILLVITLPMYDSFRIRARAIEGLALIGPVKNAMAEFYFGNKRWPVDNKEAGLGDPETLGSSDVEKIEVSGQVATIYYAIPAMGSDNTIEFVPTIASGSLQWDCRGGSVKGSYRPPTCQP